MKKDYKQLLIASKDKLDSAINLVAASVLNLDAFLKDKKYTPKELEPYDALSDRFIRAVESSIKFFRTYELYLFAVSSDSFRDLLLKMEKHEVISSVEKWIDMRDIRNRIVHDYLPDEIKNIFDMIMYDFSKELFNIKNKIQNIIDELQ